MEDSVKQRLMKFLRYKDISNSVFEKTCGMANGYVNNIRVGVSPKKLESILLNYPELNRDWLIYGEGNMLNEGYTTFDPVGVATPMSPTAMTETEKEVVLLQAKLEEKEKMIEFCDYNNNYIKEFIHLPLFLHSFLMLPHWIALSSILC